MVSSRLEKKIFWCFVVTVVVFRSSARRGIIIVEVPSLLECLSMWSL
jgi:hypothetical protein